MQHVASQLSDGEAVAKMGSPEAYGRSSKDCMATWGAAEGGGAVGAVEDGDEEAEPDEGDGGGFGVGAEGEVVEQL